MANQEMERALVFAGYEAMHAWGDGGHNGKHATEVFLQAMRWLWKDWPATRLTGELGNEERSEHLVVAVFVGSVEELRGLANFTHPCASRVTTSTPRRPSPSRSLKLMGCDS